MEHNVHWETRVITKENDTCKRKVKEALTIHKLGNQKVMNQDCGFEISKIWLEAA